MYLSFYTIKSPEMGDMMGDSTQAAAIFPINATDETDGYKIYKFLCKKSIFNPNWVSYEGDRWDRNGSYTIKEWVATGGCIFWLVKNLKCMRLFSDSHLHAPSHL